MKAQSLEENIKKASEMYGDAFYFFDSNLFVNNYNELASTFKQYYRRFNIAYSYKTNYTPRIVQIVDSLGGFAEVVSEMEVDVALKAGVKPNKIIWNGPLKNKEKVFSILLLGGTVNIDSLDEATTICEFAKKHKEHTINIGVRCNYDVGDGVVSRFGIDIDNEEFDKVLSAIKSVPNLKLISLHAHFANRNPSFWLNRAEGMLKAYDYVVNNYNMKPEILDIGGGLFGNMPSSLRSQLGIGSIKYDDYASKAAAAFEIHFKNETTPPYLFIEPGTALVADCMKFICKVETIKKIRGKYFATVTGSQKNINMSGINPPLEVVSFSNKGHHFAGIDIVGYTCIEGDVLYKGYCGNLCVGDYISIGNCGSYSLVMKPPFIFPNCPVLEIINGEIKLLKHMEKFDDLFRTYLF